MTTHSNKQNLTSVLLIAGMLAAPLALAGPGKAWGPSQDVDQRLARMSEQLDLSSAQQDEIRAILEDQATQRTLMRETMHTRIDAVLTPAQQDLIAEQQAARLERRIGQLARRLDLSPTQIEQVRDIMQAHGPSDMTSGDARAQIKAVLTEPQAQAFERIGMKSKSKRGGPDAPGRPSKPRGDQVL
ncbi:hypothetical protein CKO25_08595 [Thiocapsa imhoffii]|uniref:Periplasmic heavy metal sensor n=1 Tax=Thiocapsa imhoffii TaxID=382777 RepID=A0A9X1B8Y2_9GAMM|nr:hypothetical protein [Thiocapsa imhoffii]MBK1644703.1 hypothetical protein [Thiocapsa imhoffii]